MNKKKLSKSPHHRIERDYPIISIAGRSVVLEFSNMYTAKTISMCLGELFSLLMNSNVDIFTFFENAYNEYSHFYQIPKDEVPFFQRINSQKAPSGVQ